MSDNGSAMLAAETTEGLARLGIVHDKTLPYAPFQNGKQEMLSGSGSKGACYRCSKESLI